MPKNTYWADMQYADSAEIKLQSDAFLIKKLKDTLPIKAIIDIPMTKKVLQRYGADKIILTEDDKTLILEMKVRKKNYGDFLIEVVSNSNYAKYSIEHGLTAETPIKREMGQGWAFKPYESDLVLYFWTDTNTGYILSWKKLQLTIMQNLKNWYINAENNVRGYQVKHAKNNGYLTENISVPINDLLNLYIANKGIVI